MSDLKKGKAEKEQVPEKAQITKDAEMILYSVRDHIEYSLQVIYHRHQTSSRETYKPIDKHVVFKFNEASVTWGMWNTGVVNVKLPVKGETIATIEKLITDHTEMSTNGVRHDALFLSMILCNVYGIAYSDRRDQELINGRKILYTRPMIDVIRAGTYLQKEIDEWAKTSGARDFVKSTIEKLEEHHI